MFITWLGLQGIMCSLLFALSFFFSTVFLAGKVNFLNTGKSKREVKVLMILHQVLKFRSGICTFEYLASFCLCMSILEFSLMKTVRRLS